MKVYPIIRGYRNRASGDLEKVIDTVILIVKLISENDILELDINPLLVLEGESGVVAVDALIKLNLN